MLGLVLDAYIKIYRQIELDGANGESRRVSKSQSKSEKERKRLPGEMVSSEQARDSPVAAAERKEKAKK